MRQVIYLVFILFPMLLHGQGMSVLSGVIKDEFTGYAISSVIIDMPYGGYASTSNEEGDFVFSFPNLILDSGVVKFSSIGYETKIFQLKELNLGRPFELKLKPANQIETTLGISEAKVLVEAAVDSIKVNNINFPFFQSGFYQESAQIEDIGYVKINEALIRVERFPGEKEKLDAIRVRKTRALDWSGQSSKLATWHFLNGPAVVARSMETALPIFLEKSSLRNYKFQVDSLLSSYDNLELYVVNFEPKSSRLRGGRIGKMFIEPNSKAIVRLEYELTSRGLFDVVGGGSGRVKLKGNSLKYISQYRLEGKHWVLHENKIKLNLEYKERLDRSFDANTTWQLVFVATETRQLMDEMIKESELLLDTSNFRKSTNLGLDFWEGQSFIKPTPAMLEIQQNLTRR